MTFWPFAAAVGAVLFSGGGLFFKNLLFYLKPSLSEVSGRPMLKMWLVLRAATSSDGDPWPNLWSCG